MQIDDLAPVRVPVQESHCVFLEIFYFKHKTTDILSGVGINKQ